MAGHKPKPSTYRAQQRTLTGSRSLSDRTIAWLLGNHDRETSKLCQTVSQRNQIMQQLQPPHEERNQRCPGKRARCNKDTLTTADHINTASISDQTVLADDTACQNPELERRKTGLHNATGYKSTKSEPCRKSQRLRSVTSHLDSERESENRA